MKSVLCSVAALSWCWAFVGMAEVETAAQWAEREKGALATINETSLAQTLTSGAPALSALFAEIRTGGASDALAATRIAALTQYVMRPGREAVRQAYADALLAAARNAKDADVVCFFLNQLRWCGLPRQADAIRAFEHSSGAGVADLAAMTVQAVTADRSAHAPSVADTRCAAFNKELAGLAPAALTPRLLQAFDDADPAYAGVALSWARAAGGPKETRLWVAKLTAAADPVRKTMLLDMLAARRDAAAAEAVAACLSDADDGVAVAAQRALAALSGDAFAKRLPSLLTALPQGRSGAMRETLRTFPTAWLEPVFLTDFGRFGDAGKCMTLEILKERRSGRALSVGLAALDEKNEEVVVAGYRLLREIAGPEQAPLLVARLQAADGRVLSEAENAVAAAARRDAGGAYARALNDALASAADARKPPLLETAARVGGDVLRTSVENATESPDGEVATAAVRALAEWPDDATVPALLSLAMAAPDAKRQALAVRGVLKKAEAHPELGVRFASVWKAVRTRPGNTENKKTLDALFKVAEPIPFENGFVSLFNARDLDGWIGSTNGYAVENGLLYCIPSKGGKLLTAKEYDNFVLRFEFRVCTNSNNGLGIRCPIEGDAAYNGMELQILDDSGSDYTKLHDYQYHGSIYGVVPAKRGFQKKVGEWNVQEVRAVGPHITVVLNGEVIVDANLSEIKETVDGKAHPGLHNAKGHIAWLGHGTRVEWRNIRLKEVPSEVGKTAARRSGNEQYGNSNAEHRTPNIER